MGRRVLTYTRADIKAVSDFFSDFRRDRVVIVTSQNLRSSTSHLDRPV